MSTPTIAVIIVAAGSGTRLGHPEPKAFVPLGDGTVLSAAVAGVLGMTSPPHLVLVVPDDRVDSTRSSFASAAAAASAVLDVVPGGASRQESVAHGLAVLPPGIDTVLVHDAARALTPSLVFDEVAGAVRARNRGIVPALDVVDTIKRVDGSIVTATIDRDELVAVQTPQAFRLARLRRAHAAATDATDDAALVEANGGRVVTVDGELSNRKITDRADLEWANEFIAGEIAAGAST